jgi:hypothetical protein
MSERIRERCRAGLDALDHSDPVMAARIRELLHDGWIHSHLAGDRARRRLSADHPGAAGAAVDTAGGRRFGRRHRDAATHLLLLRYPIPRAARSRESRARFKWVKLEAIGAQSLLPA